MNSILLPCCLLVALAAGNPQGSSSVSESSESASREGRGFYGSFKKPNYHYEQPMVYQTKQLYPQQPFFGYQQSKSFGHRYQPSSYNSFKNQYNFAKYKQEVPSKEAIKRALSNAGIHIPRGIVIMITGDEDFASSSNQFQNQFQGKNTDNNNGNKEVCIVIGEGKDKKKVCISNPIVNQPAVANNACCQRVQGGTYCSDDCLAQQQAIEDIPALPGQGSKNCDKICGGPNPPAVCSALCPGSGKSPAASVSPSVSASTPGLVPLEVQAVLNKPVQALGISNYFDEGSVVGAFTGKNPANPNAALACVNGQETCVSVTNACGSSSNGEGICLNPGSLTEANPFTVNANQAFQAGISALDSQLSGREPGRYYSWKYQIYYHVSDKAALLWMGHVQIVQEELQWTLGLYYWLDPNGDLRLMYYSATPTDGYVAQESIWPGFTPYEWLDKALFNRHFASQQLIGNQQFIQKFHVKKE